MKPVAQVNRLTHAEQNRIREDAEQRWLKATTEAIGAAELDGIDPAQVALAMGEIAYRWGARTLEQAEFQGGLREREPAPSQYKDWWCEECDYLWGGPDRAPICPLCRADVSTKDATPVKPTVLPNEPVVPPPRSWNENRVEWVDSGSVWECPGPECSRLNPAAKDRCWHCGRARG